MNYFIENLDNQCPGGVYLCQISDDISCGACCGLYNVADPSFSALDAMLRKRTELFSRTRRDYDSLVEFKTIVESTENQDRPYPDFHHCPYIGFIGEHDSRPGCLLHPLGKGNNGTDHRGMSDWGGFACATYFCPTCGNLAARYKKILRASASNWHIYGLMVTETEALETFFSMIEKTAEIEIDPDRDIKNPVFITVVKRFFDLKTTWPFRPDPYNRLGNYFFKDALYPRKEIPYEAFNVQASELDPILKSLGSEFRSKSELDQAEKILTVLINASYERL